MAKEKLILIVIVVVGLVLRLYNLNQSLWLDEASQAQMSAMSVSSIWFDRQADFHPPLFYLLAHFWMILGTQEVWLRLLPVIMGTLAIPLMYRFASELGNHKLGLLAAAVLAANPFHIYYSQEFRAYSLMVLLGLVSMRLYFQNSKWLGVVNALCLYTHYSGIFLLTAQVFHSMVLDRKRVSFLIVSLFVSTLLYLPWVPQLVGQFRSAVNIDSFLPGWRSVLTLAPAKAVPLTLFKFVAGRITLVSPRVYAVYILFVLGVTFAAIAMSQGKRRLLYSWVFVPLILSSAISFVFPQTQPFRLIFILPGLLILLAESCVRFPKIFIPMLLYISVVGNLMYFTRDRLQREQWREAIRFLQQTNASVVIKFSGKFAPFTWYANDMEVIAAVPTFPAKESEVAMVLGNNTIGKKDLYLLEYLTGLTDPSGIVDLTIENLGYAKVDTRNFEGVGFIYHYSKEL